MNEAFDSPMFFQDFNERNLDLLNQANEGYDLLYARQHPAQHPAQPPPPPPPPAPAFDFDTSLEFEVPHRRATRDAHGASSVSSISASLALKDPHGHHTLMSPQSLSDDNRVAAGTAGAAGGAGGAGVAHASGRPAPTRKQLAEEQDAILLARDDCELTEEELQAKKKAQNRAAQRAFRERKEGKLKELEARLNESEEEKQRLREQLSLIRKETMARGAAASDGTIFNFPASQGVFILEMTAGHPIAPNAQLGKVYDAPDDPSTRLLAVGAVWDYLHGKAEDYEREGRYIDVVAVMAQLKGKERCHGYGPAYPLAQVEAAVAQSLQ